MARYHEIEASFWDDPEIQELTKEQKLLYVYLFSNPLCRPSGLYRISLKTADFHLGLGRGFEEAWKGLQNGKPLILYDEKMKLIWVIGKLKRFIKSLDDKNPIKKSVDRDIEEFKDSTIIPYFLKKYERVYKAPLEGLGRVDIPIPIPIPIDTKEGGMGGDDKDPIAKTKFLDFVFLTEEEHKKLIEKFGEIGTQERIEKLNNYIGSKGKRYKSHYHTILSWEAKDKPKNKPFRRQL